MKNKPYTLDDLTSAVEDRKFHKTTYDRLLNEIDVQTKKIEELQRQLHDAEASLYKEDRKILDIIGDLKLNDTKRRQDT